MKFWEESGIPRGTRVAQTATAGAVSSLRGARFGEGPFSAWLDNQRKLLIALAATVLHTALYTGPNHFPVVPPHALQMSRLDSWVPFIPETGWLYWSDYLLVFFGFQLCRAPGTTAQFVKAFVSLIALGTFVHWIYPTIYPRELFPIPAGADAITRGALRAFRVIDSPASCLPSLHVAACYLVVFACWPQAPRLRWLFLGWATAVAVSTLTFKQHYAVDLLAGFALTGVVWFVFYRWLPSRNQGWRELYRW